MMARKRLVVLSVLLWLVIWSAPPLKAVDLESLSLKQALPEGWTLIHGPQIYTRKTLFEHIDGQAELFFKYGFQKSVFTIYRNEGNPKDQVELDIYDMGNVLQAFGIFSRFRNEERPAGIGLDSYYDDHSLIFYEGNYFVMLYATETDPSVLKALARMVSLRISDPSSPPKEIDYFPKEGLKPGSIQYFSEGLLGYQFLKRGFRGAYEGKVEVKDKVKGKKIEGKEFHLFLAIFKDSQEAIRSLKIYRDELTKRGKVQIEVPISFGPNALKGEDPYQGKSIVVAKGLYLIGVVGYEREKEGERLLGEFMKRVE